MKPGQMALVLSILPMMFHCAGNRKATTFQSRPCTEIDVYYDSLEYSSKWTRSFDRHFGVSDKLNKLIFYYFPSFLPPQVCIIDLAKHPFMVKTLKPIDIDSTKEYYWTCDTCTYDSARIQSAETIFVDSQYIDTLFAFTSVKKQCDPKDSLVYFLPFDGISYTLYINNRSRGTHSFEFIDGFYLDRKYDDVIELFQKYMYADENQVRSITNRKSYSKEIREDQLIR